MGTFAGIQFHDAAQSFGARAGLEWSVEFAELDTEGNDWINANLRRWSRHLGEAGNEHAVEIQKQGNGSLLRPLQRIGY